MQGVRDGGEQRQRRDDVVDALDAFVDGGELVVDLVRSMGREQGTIPLATAVASCLNRRWSMTARAPPATVYIKKGFEPRTCV